MKNYKQLINYKLIRIKANWLNFQCRKFNHNYGIGNYQRIYHYHIRKTGGTSLNHMFLDQGTDSSGSVYSRLSQNLCALSGDKVFVGWDKPLIEKGHYFYAFSHIPMHKLNILENTFTYTCLRDPAKRVISHFRMLKEYAEKNIKHPCMDTEGVWLGNSFKDFVDNMPAEHLLNQLYMFSKDFNVDEAVENIQQCSCYFFTEEFAMGIDKISRSLGLALQPIHMRKGRHTITISDNDLKYLKTKLDPEYKLCRDLKKKT